MIKNLQDLKREATKRGSFFFTVANWQDKCHEVLPTGDFTGYLVDSILEADLTTRQFLVRSYRVLGSRLDIHREAEFTNLEEALAKAGEWQKRDKK